MKGMKKAIGKLLIFLQHGLIGNSVGRPEPGQMCVQSAVSRATNAEFNDQPECVDEEVRCLGIWLNDLGVWTSKKQRAQALQMFAVAQLGSSEWSDKITGGHCGFDYDHKFNQRLAERLEKYVWTDEVRADFNRWALKQGMQMSYTYVPETVLFYIDSWHDLANPRRRLKLVKQFIAQAVETLIELKSPGTKYLCMVKEFNDGEEAQA